MTLKLVPGRAVVVEKVVSAEDIEEFGRLTGDRGDHHLGLGGRPPIAQGLLIGSVATKLGGDLSYLARVMRLELVRPVVAGSTVTAELSVREFRRSRGAWSVDLSGTVSDAEGVAIRMETEGVLAAERFEVPELWEDFSYRAGMDSSKAEPADVVAAIAAIPYGRPPDPDPAAWAPAAVVEHWCGTCSSKHYLLAELLASRWPELTVELWHRVYLARPEAVRKLYGEAAAAAIPAEGLVDVHTYARLGMGVVVDATFPAPARFDGRTDMALWCGDGFDVPGGRFPAATKRRLVALHCIPAVREPFIAVLASS